MNNTQRNRDIERFLQAPFPPWLIDGAISQANLTAREADAIRLCGRQDLTREKAAEVLDVSRNGLQNWYDSGMGKLYSAWSGQSWFERLKQ